jgi:restriction system protein
MSLWLVRAGRHGEQEQGALEHNVVTIGWQKLPDLSHIQNKEELTEIYKPVYPEHRGLTVSNRVGQVWRFVKEIQKGDLVALPLKTQSMIAVGEVVGDYEYKELTPLIKHIRKVKWLKTIPRSEFDPDILYSFGSLLTVCTIKRNDAENRVRILLGQKKTDVSPISSETAEESIDIEQSAKDQIVKHIETKFKGHELATLVDAILKAQGYVTKKSLPGPDGGVDILAASGPLGFGEPRICVQVKSSSSAVDSKIIRELMGVMSKVGANQGLIVAWGGFNSGAINEAKDSFFSIRTWDQGVLLEEIFKYYDRFDDELKAALPLKRIWGLVLEEESSE